jgi:hypothetical protein
VKTYLLLQRHPVKCGPHINSPIREEWRPAGRFKARGPQEAKFKAFAITGCPNPERDLVIYATIENPAE